MRQKEQQLLNILSSMGKAVIAYSGGVDSAFLLYAAKRALGAENVLAVIGESPTYPQEEVGAAIATAQKLGVDYQLIQTEEFADENFVCNSTERCYYCKSELFAKLKEIAQQKGISFVLDGSNFDDLSDYRPGGRAKKELGVRSPLQEAGLTKDEIRRLSKKANLPTADKPSFACLSSRIPYGTRITEDLVARIEAGENFLKSLGFKQLRVRHHGDIVRIELEGEAIAEVLSNGLKGKIVKKFEELGYNYVTIDLKGYRSGSLNEVIKNGRALQQ